MWMKSEMKIKGAHGESLMVMMRMMRVVMVSMMSDEGSNGEYDEWLCRE